MEVVFHLFSFGGSAEDVLLEQVEPGLWVSPAFNLPASTSTITGFKIRKDHYWDVNYGGTFSAFDTPFQAIEGGANIQVNATSDFVIRVTLDLRDTAQPTITISQIPVWSVIGGFNSWEGDLNMTEESSGIWVSPEFTVDDEGFKLRFNKALDQDYGGTFVAFGSSFPGVSKGENIKVEAGKTVWAKLDLTSPDSPQITVFEVVPPAVWSVIGAFNGWADDLDMTEVSPGIWESPSFETVGGEYGGFKMRKNHGWDVSYGGTFLNFGEAFEAELNGGTKIVIGESGQTYTVVVTLDLTNSDAPLITVNNVSVWSVIGSFSNWGTDVDLVEVESGVWQGVLSDIPANTEFKFRKNHDWSENLGYTESETFTITPGETFGLAGSGGNLKLADAGSYVVRLDLNTMSSLVTRQY